MVTPDELGAVEIFSALDQTGREKLSRAAADITLAPDEYAAHQSSSTRRWTRWQRR
ncbi:MAG: hypothetical protein ACLPV4_10755 [Solirubrobacteraceae bacterium]